MNVKKSSFILTVPLKFVTLISNKIAFKLSSEKQHFIVPITDGHPF